MATHGITQLGLALMQEKPNTRDGKRNSKQQSAYYLSEPIDEEQAQKEYGSEKMDTPASSAFHNGVVCCDCAGGGSGGRR